MKTTREQRETMRQLVSMHSGSNSTAWRDALDDADLASEAISYLNDHAIYHAGMSEQLRAHLRYGNVKTCAECGLKSGFHTPFCSQSTCADWDARPRYHYDGFLGVHRNRERDDIYGRLDDIEQCLRGALRPRGDFIVCRGGAGGRARP